jgi:hypothetical protein
MKVRKTIYGPTRYMLFANDEEEVEFSLSTPFKVFSGNAVVAPLVHNLGIRVELLSWHPGRLTFSERTQYSLDRTMDEPQGRVGSSGGEENRLSPWIRTPISLVRSIVCTPSLLYRLPF